MCRVATRHSEVCGKKPLLQLRACVPGHKSSIAPLVESLIAQVRDLACASEKEFEIETALREALANAAVHGCRNDPSKVIECSLSCSDWGELTIVVRDPGRGFDPTAVPDPTTGENVFATHGRGIHLIRQVADEVWFERGGSEIHMVLKRRNDDWRTRRKMASVSS
jgi:serine/threonine-protein kinase RsbW